MKLLETKFASRKNAKEKGKLFTTGLKIKVCEVKLKPQLFEINTIFYIYVKIYVENWDLHQKSEDKNASIFGIMPKTDCSQKRVLSGCL